MSASPLVLISRALPEGWLDRLAGHCELLIGPADQIGLAPALQARLAEAEGLLCMLTDRVDAALLAGAPRLRVVSTMAVGVDHIDLAACAERGIVVGHTPGVLTDATADLTLALLLAAARGLPQAALDAREGRWGRWSPTAWLGVDLRGATLGIVGFGRIGRAVAERAAGFGLRVLVAQRTAVNQPGIEQVPLQQLLARSDFVSLHVPLTEETKGLIDARALRSMKRSAILLNTARGAIVDQAALVDALSAHTIAGAALDVTDPEPLPPSHALFGLRNALVLPHIGSATVGTRRRMAELACENLLAGLQGRTLPHAVR
jgi:lactate dehydrogenase-like 2-hydroxyacid dehydrogenase